MAAIILLALAVAGAALLAFGTLADVAVLGVAGVVVLAAAVAGCGAFVVVPPNESKVLILLGRYTGTVTTAGWCWLNPLTSIWRETISLRVRNFQSDRTKVNDAGGSPVEIAAVVVWRVVDTAKAVFDVEDSSSSSSCRARPRCATSRRSSRTTTSATAGCRCAATPTR